MTMLWYKIVLKIGVELKEIKSPTSIYIPLGTQLKNASKEASMCASNKKTFGEPS
jgi:hypothetical protein